MADEFLRFEVNGEHSEASPENTSLYTFIGELAVYDHIYHNFDKEENMVAHIWKTSIGEEQFWRVANFMLQNGFLAIMNNDKVSQYDKNAYDDMINRAVQSGLEDLGDYPPDFDG